MYPQELSLSTPAILIAQAGYILLTGIMTVLVARSLAKNGRVFLVDAFEGNAPLAEAINQLLVMGFYLVNSGWVLVQLEAYTHVASIPDLVEVYAARAGSVLIVLGVMHFMNIYVFNRYRRAALSRRALSLTPPFAPNRSIIEVPVGAER